MSIMKWFNKPKWQSPNEQVRTTAVQTSDDVDLLNALTDIVNNDSSVKVKKAALARIKKPDDLVDILHQHPDKEIKKQTSKKLIQWFADSDDKQQIATINKITDAETLRALAEVAKNKPSRKYAIEQIKQQGFLSELLFKESELELQQLILNKIEQPNKLNKLIKKAKKQSDLYHLINAKLTDNSEPNHNKSAIELCQQLENVVHGKDHNLELTSINTEWRNIENLVSEPIKLRFNGAFEAAKMILDPEYRAHFLKQQKHQRASTQLHELEQLLTKQNQMTLKQVQDAISKYQGMNETDFVDVEHTRYQNAIDQLVTRREEIQKDQQIPDAVTAVLDELNKQLSKQIVRPELLSQFKKRWHNVTKNIKPSDALTTIKQQFADGSLKLAEKIEQSAQLRQDAAKKAVSLIEPTIEQIKEGHLIKAKEMSNQIAELKKTAGYNHPTINDNKYQLDSVWQQLKDLRKWQKWSNDKARQDIIDELHAMIGKGQHPDAVLKKLKEANERWYALEDMEKLPGDKFPSRNQKMWQEFRMVSKALFEPTQPFFEKRSEQQDDYLAKIETHIKTIQETDLEQTSERDLARLSRHAIKFLKSLDQLPPKERGKTAKKLRQVIAPIDTKLSEFYAAAESKKIKLIEQAKALTDMEDQNEAIESAKALQQQWKTAGIVKQHTERKLWKKFRKANDVIFKRREQEHQEKQAAHQEQQKQAQLIIDQFKAQANKVKTIDGLNEFKADFNKQWFEIDKPENLLKHDYQHVLQLIDNQTQKLKSSAILKEHKAKQKLDQIFTDFESGQITDEQKEESANKLLTEALVAFFQPRFTTSEQQDLASLLIQAEFITGLETPAEFMKERMAYQVKILSERMSGEKSDNNQQVDQWFSLWYLTPKNDAQFLKANNKRIKQVLKAMTAQLT